MHTIIPCYIYMFVLIVTNLNRYCCSECLLIHVALFTMRSVSWSFSLTVHYLSFLYNVHVWYHRYMTTCTCNTVDNLLILLLTYLKCYWCKLVYSCNLLQNIIQYTVTHSHTHLDYIIIQAFLLKLHPCTLLLSVFHIQIPIDTINA